MESIAAHNVQIAASEQKAQVVVGVVRDALKIKQLSDINAANATSMVSERRALASTGTDLQKSYGAVPNSGTTHMATVWRTWVSVTFQILHLLRTH